LSTAKCARKEECQPYQEEPDDGRPDGLYEAEEALQLGVAGGGVGPGPVCAQAVHQVRLDGPLQLVAHRVQRDVDANDKEHAILACSFFFGNVIGGGCGTAGACLRHQVVGSSSCLTCLLPLLPLLPLLLSAAAFIGAPSFVVDNIVIK
jgi:hypothetical protein